ncbi:hypothetical protein NQ315_014357 [Exocentrus adspersus]|uniref:Uncharacterized protein n=1 Tax=Exocentrus adspersus TaxID=1586481 RepID=A0AAV8V9N3_9CUCU|nr:hypothetical protein NQ315_014357 [Exocentrus adspersus]
MSNGLLPPVPDLIPISVLRKSPHSTNNSNGDGIRECAPCADRSEVMGEQRSRRRTANQPADDLIDSAGSRGSSAAPQAPQSRKARSERHRKSDRRRGHRKPARTRSDSKHFKYRETSSPNSSPERPANPRVNPIFVWIRQEDTRIVDVKCEDYDKRNRILLTKTAQGWRAIPRTETLVPSLKEAVNRDPQLSQSHHHHHHRNRKSRKSKVRRRSTGVQVESDIGQDDIEDFDNDQEEQDAEVQTQSSPPWMSADNINVETLLPSHTIKVKRSTSPDRSPQRDTTNVNSVVTDTAHTPPIKCSADKICDVSPLDNLLAVAELEFNQQIQSGEWHKSQEENTGVIKEKTVAFEKTFSDEVDEDVDKEFIHNLEQLNNFIESEGNKLDMDTNFVSNEQKSEECDYTEDDDNNLAMVDILSRLEQSLRSPECVESNNCDTSIETKSEEERDKVHDETDDDNCNADNDDTFKPSEYENLFKENDIKTGEPELENTNIENEKHEVISLVESSTMIDDEEPTDLSLKSKVETMAVTNSNCGVTDEQPTDLSIPKAPFNRVSTPRPPSQNSEAIQSPQPSGIPAVPPSPDIVTTTATSNINTKRKSVFLESILSNSTKKIALNSEVTIIRQKEPLDLGKCRKSASPTVTCSEEINSTPSDLEPPPKKFKSLDITLRTLLDEEIEKPEDIRVPEKTMVAETPRLLELLKCDSDSDPLTQLKQLLVDPTIVVPDPMLVPKDRFSQILTRPGTEIPKLLKERPELRLPEALAYPHIMQDPNMLVLNIHHLESILSSKASQYSDQNEKSNSEKFLEKSTRKIDKSNSDSTRDSPNLTTKKKSSGETVNKSSVETQGKSFNELANDIDAATQAAFSQMVWLPYLNHLEAMSLGSHSDVMKMLTSFPFYPNQMPDFSHILGASRFPSPLGISMQPPMNYGSPLELGMWQEAMLQATMLRNKNNLENFKHPFREHLDKISIPPGARKPMITGHNSHNQRMHNLNKQASFSGSMYPPPSNSHSYQNPYMNLNIPNSYQGNSKSNLQIPQFNPMSHQKNHMSQQKYGSSHSQKNLSHYQHQQKFDNQSFGSAYSNLTEQEKNQYLHRLNNQESTQYQASVHNQRKEPGPQKSKLAFKQFPNVPQSSQRSPQRSIPLHELKEKSSVDFCRQQTNQPIDLSGSTTPGSKLKVKQHLIDPANTPKLLKHHDDVPEVGSTTASIEEMQDAHKQLWHPLFGK